ncbi:MAG TPA: glycosyltransferase family 4 protein [Acetivibrio saccincola]|uniref:glycosyltransferase family 4 protein n=1 Tax=Acetivibrio saccincola TaxID=1677857 RepID=UPI002CE4792B|nr:glycosyltransferase family 4 protein [Acetivibrio saccincola]HOA97563.1 glycosyltransferase family 4 protein [Acetivibrio saccincola]HQD27734.1 glycosyltransferase family 4 protein [Acetivibrio saccincola]
MRVLMLSWEYPPRIVGGISRVVHGLAQKLGERGNEVHVITCWEMGTKEFEKDKDVYIHRVHSYDVTPNNFVDWVLQLNFSLLEHSIKLINETGKFDIIHAHDWIVAFAARVLKHSYFIPLISTIHATEYGRNCGIHDDTQRYINSIEWWMAYESWRIIVNSEYMKEEVKHVFQVPEDKIDIIPNGVDLDKFDGYEKDMDFRRKYARDNEKIIFFVGRLVNEKGVHVLIDSVPKVLQYYNDAKFVIAGKGPQLEHLKAKANYMGVSHKVYFTGYVSDEELSKIYKCADVAVFPSLYEPFGIVALEGMVANVPVVVSDTGGLSGIVEHGVDGMKSYTGNANSLADSILEILHKPDKAEKMKENALKKVHSIYNWKVITDKTIEVYKNIINESKKANWSMSIMKNKLD